MDELREYIRVVEGLILPDEKKKEKRFRDFQRWKYSDLCVSYP